MPPRGGTASVSGEPTRISPEKTLSTTLGQSIAQEPCEDEASTPPDTPPTNMRHHGHRAIIVVSPKLAARGLQDGGEK